MQISDPTHKQGLIEDITFLTGVDTTKFPTADRIRGINEWCRTVLTWAFESYGGWQLTNDEAVINLSATVATYGIPVTALSIKKVDVLKEDGVTWDHLLPLPLESIKGSEGEFLKTTGAPRYYRPSGENVKLYPTPNYTISNGLKLFIDEQLSQFATTETASVPAFASAFHRICSIGPSMEYAIVNGPANKATQLSNLLADYEKRFKKFYAKRWKDNFPPRIKVVDSVQQYQ